MIGWFTPQAPRYLTDHCTPVSDTVFRQRPRSASSHQVSVPRYRLSTYGHRAFSVAGPTVWNSLPEDPMRDPECSVDSYSHWRHFYFRSTSVFTALEVCYENALYKFTFDIWHNSICQLAAQCIVASILHSLLQAVFFADKCQNGSAVLHIDCMGSGYSGINFPQNVYLGFFTFWKFSKWCRLET